MGSSNDKKSSDHFSDCFPTCRALIFKATKQQTIPVETKDDFVHYCKMHPLLLREYPFLLDLIMVEQALSKLRYAPEKTFAPHTAIIVNPQLELISVQYSGLFQLIHDITFIPDYGQSHVLIFRRPGSDRIETRDAHPHDLLALKIITEELDYNLVARESGVTLGKIDDIIYRGIQMGILLSPPSRIRRGSRFSNDFITDKKFFSSPVFTLQWHITQKCDLHCLHCYDRSERKTMTLQQGIDILDDLYNFCKKQFVYGQVTFTGGNPLLHPKFIELYQEAVDRGFLTGILGNPMERSRIDEIVHIRKPQFYQVSLEGLQPHSDYIRGKGHFDRTIQFLALLKELDIRSMVMLTLTRNNIDQVLELAEFLRDKVDYFNFNRLSMVGEGASLVSADIDSYPQFLKEYQAAAEKNPIMGLKDNFFNLIARQNNQQYFYGGCAGYGCGAAFNFVSLLADGRVDACRKFDSPMGNIYKNTLDEIYSGELAERYRNGSSACENCDIHPVCRGCMAVSYGMGKDVFTELDPYCFLTK